MHTRKQKIADSCSTKGLFPAEDLVWLLGAFALVSLTLGPSGCGSSANDERTAVEVTSIAPNNGYNYTPVPLVIRGRGLGQVHASPEEEGGEKYVPQKTPEGKVRLEMWEGSSDSLGRGFALREVAATSPSQVKAVVPAGVYPGKYRLVLRRGGEMIFTDHRYLVLQQESNTGPPRIARVEPKRVETGRPNRLTVVGANLARTIRVSVEGPAPPRGSPFLDLKEFGFRFGWPVFTIRRRPLTDVRNENKAKISAALPRDLPPGEYMVQVQTATHRGHRPEAEKTFVVEPAPQGLSAAPLYYAIYFGILGLIFFIALAMAWRKGAVGIRSRRQVLNLCWMLGGLLFYLVLIGTPQFVVSRLL